MKALRDVVVSRRDQDTPTVLAALRVRLGELDKIDPPKAATEDDTERKKRGTRDRQQTSGRDRGTA